ncbi:MAG: pyruvate synthase subunit PorA [Chloroflexi bacterium]|nr:pyruvate synthase subunit PorA [Chloroflexota bacterium]
MTNTQVKGELRVLTGNAAAAWGALLSRPDVIALYPITPQTEVVELLSQFHANGILKAEMMQVEGENSAISAVIAASVAGGRVFTATSSWGLAFMYDAVLMAGGTRIPLVMVNVNRETPGIYAVSCGRQDMMSVRDAGWIQIEAENCQDILDSVIIAYRLAEDADVLLPVMVSYDGYYLSFLSEDIIIPRQEDVDAFLAPLKSQPERLKLVPGGPLGFHAHALLEDFMEYRYKHSQALERAKVKQVEIEQEYGKIIGRTYSGPIEEYRTEDADVVVIAMGSSAGTSRVAIDRQREKGIKVGLVKIRTFRPFPRELLGKALKGKKGIAVIDRSICFGWNMGHLCMETKAVLHDIQSTVPVADYITGIGSLDITIDHIMRAIDEIYNASKGKPVKEVSWLPLE